jgi:hypothetical protein
MSGRRLSSRARGVVKVAGGIALKFCGFGITFAEISFCTRLEDSIKETVNIVKSTWKEARL